MYFHAERVSPHPLPPAIRPCVHCGRSNHGWAQESRVGAAQSRVDRLYPATATVPSYRGRCTAGATAPCACGSARGAATRIARRRRTRVGPRRRARRRATRKMHLQTRRCASQGRVTRAKSHVVTGWRDPTYRVAAAIKGSSHRVDQHGTCHVQVQDATRATTADPSECSRRTCM